MEINKSNEAGSRWLQGEDQQQKADNGTAQVARRVGSKSQDSWDTVGADCVDVGSTEQPSAV